MWLLWHHQAIQATLCSQRRTIKEEGPACTGHALVMDHAIISNAKVIHVFLLLHISSPAPSSLPSSLHHPPYTLHPPRPHALSSPLSPPTIGGCGCRSALGPGPKGCATLRLMILHSDDQIRKRPTTAAAPSGKSGHCDSSSLVSYYPCVRA